MRRSLLALAALIMLSALPCRAQVANGFALEDACIGRLDSAWWKPSVVSIQGLSL